jgi:hypothetical protein
LSQVIQNLVENSERKGSFGTPRNIWEVNTVKPLSIISEGAAKNKRMLRNDCCRKVIYTGNVLGPEKVDNTCMKTMHAGTMDRSFLC